jgi:hypothetical protein
MQMTKVAVNKCYGGFSLSDEAVEECLRRGMTVETIDEANDRDRPRDEHADFWKEERTRYAACFSKYYPSKWSYSDPDFRTHPIILAVIEDLGEAANGQCANIKIVEVPDDVSWHIEEYDGQEWIAEDHRTW